MLLIIKIQIQREIATDNIRIDRKQLERVHERTTKAKEIKIKFKHKITIKI